MDKTELVVMKDTKDWQIMLTGKSSILSTSGETQWLTLSRYLSDKGWVIADELNFYEDSPELNELIMKSVDMSNNSDISEDTEDAGDEIYYSVECPEPSSEEEYVDAAVKCVDAWLTSLQSEDTDKYYRNKGFEITVIEEDSNKQKCNYLSCGIVNDKKEFVVEICFTAEDCGEGTFYDAHYQEGRYTEAGTYWSGNYICARFRYDDGKVSLLNMGDRDMSGNIQSGLNGIPTGEYVNFFEFARRSDYDKAVEDSFVPYGSYTVSKNLTMTEDGMPINVDIYAFSVDDETDTSYKAIWDERAYIDGSPTYSTGLYFTDNGTGHMPDVLPKDFKLTFDNYDGDANPDFCCRYDNDDDGTFYVLESVQTDGRIFNLSGRAFEGGIYIAGCDEASPRLQKTDEYPYTGWKVEKGRYYPTDQYGNEISLPKLNMYSDRLYLPDEKKFYSEDETKVTCFLWNNTDSPITTDGTYSIQLSEGKNWKTVSEKLSCEAVTIEPRKCAEITYDISSLNDRKKAAYRILQTCGELEAGGKFFCYGEKYDQFFASASPLYIGGYCGELEIEKSEFNELDIRSAVLLDGIKRYPVKIEKNYGYGDNYKYTYIIPKYPDKTGKYELLLNDSISCELEITEGTDILPTVEVSPLLTDDHIEIAIEADRALTVSDPFVFKKINQGYELTSICSVDEDDLELIKNKKETITFKDGYSEQMENEDLDEIYSYVMEVFSSDEYQYAAKTYEELGITKNTTKEELFDILKKRYAYDPEGSYLAVITLYCDDDRYELYIYDMKR